MIETLLTSLASSSGEVYTTADNRRVLFARCTAIVEIYERKNIVNAVDGKSYTIKAGHRVALRCAEIETTRPADVAFLRSQSRFEFSADFQRKDGVFERLLFDIVPETLDVCGGDWLFHVNSSGELVKKLIAF